MPRTTEDTFADELETSARSLLGNMDSIGIWRVGRHATPSPYDKILVGMLDFADPAVPSAIVFLTGFTERGRAEIFYESPFAGKDSFSVSSPLSHSPSIEWLKALEELQELKL